MKFKYFTPDTKRTKVTTREMLNEAIALLVLESGEDYKDEGAVRRKLRANCKRHRLNDSSPAA